MPTYVDTSALLRLVERRGDVSLVESAMQDSPTSSELAYVECWTSVHRKWHDGQISLSERDQLLHLLEEEAIGPTILLKLDGGCLAEATSIAARFPLRTLDAIHLATAVLAERRLVGPGLPLRFCTADSRQATAARGLFGPAKVELVPPSR